MADKEYMLLGTGGGRGLTTGPLDRKQKAKLGSVRQPSDSCNILPFVTLPSKELGFGLFLWDSGACSHVRIKFASSKRCSIHNLDTVKKRAAENHRKKKGRNFTTQRTSKNIDAEDSSLSLKIRLGASGS